MISLVEENNVAIVNSQQMSISPKRKARFYRCQADKNATYHKGIKLSNLKMFYAKAICRVFTKTTNYKTWNEKPLFEKSTQRISLFDGRKNV
jgi:hypothetical protein